MSLALLYNNNGRRSGGLRTARRVDNQASGSFTFLTNGLVSSDGTATYFTNEGSLIQVPGAVSNSTIEPSFTQTATGTTSVQGGGLEFVGGGTVDGTISGSAGTHMEFDGASWSFASSSSISSGGSVAFVQDGEVVNVDGAYDVLGQTYAKGSTVNFNAPITALGSDLVLSGADAETCRGRDVQRDEPGVLRWGVERWWWHGPCGERVDALDGRHGGVARGSGTLDIGGGATLSLEHGATTTSRRSTEWSWRTRER